MIKMVKYTVNKELSWRKLGENTIILDTTTNKQVHQLNETASIIWDGLINEKDLEAIANDLRENFYDCSENILEDIENTITSFKNKNLLLEN